MKTLPPSHLLRLLSIVVASALMAGCSYSTRFVVLNETSAPLNVEYRYGALPQAQNSEIPRYPLESPTIKSSDDVFDRDVSWHAPSPDSTVVNAEQGHIRIQLPPRTALRLAEVINYTDSDWTQQVNITRIELTGTSGTVVLDGDQVRKHFRETDGVYLLKYQ